MSECKTSDCDEEKVCSVLAGSIASIPDQPELRYLLRSPFYDAINKRILAAAVDFAERNVPLGGTVASLALGYLPHYSEIYSYLWSN